MRAEAEVGFHAEGASGPWRDGAAERGAAAPAGDAVGAEEREEALLGGRVAVRADGRHHGGAFFPGEEVGHRTERATVGRVDNP